MMVDLPDSPAPAEWLVRSDRGRPGSGHSISRTQQQDLDCPIHQFLVILNSSIDTSIARESFLVRLDGFGIHAAHDSGFGDITDVIQMT